VWKKNSENMMIKNIKNIFNGILLLVFSCSPVKTVKTSESPTIDQKCLEYNGNDGSGYTFTNKCVNFYFKHSKNAYVLDRIWNQNDKIYSINIGLIPVLSKFNDSIGNNIIIEVFDIDSFPPNTIILNTTKDQKLSGERKIPKKQAVYFSTDFTSTWDNPREPFKGIFSIFVGKKYVYKLTYISTESTFDKNISVYEYIENSFKILD
jgi:hypothetical protein